MNNDIPDQESKADMGVLSDTKNLRGREVLEYLKSRTPVYHDSNIFFRDIQYGIQSMLRERGSRVRYSVAESLARQVTGSLEKENVLVRLDRQTWRVNDLTYKTPPVKKVSAPEKARPAAAPGASGSGAVPPATPAQSPAGSAPGGS